MKLHKAVITAAGSGQRGLPSQTLVDRDGVTKTALQIQIEEATSAGISELCVVINAGERAAFQAAAGGYGGDLLFIEQSAPRGYGDAIARARAFVGDEPFLHLVGDHLCMSKRGNTCAQQLVAIAEAHACAISAVQATRESLLPSFGAIGGKRISGAHALYAIEAVLEKPTPTEAEQTLIVPGLRAGHYLCFFGMHVLTPGVMPILDGLLQRNSGNVWLSTALAELATRERYLAYELDGSRYDIGMKYGLFNAQLALALNSKDRADVLANILEVVAD
jgi:UTP--glucose-1-phosphate uridylyltransferase